MARNKEGGEWLTPAEAAAMLGKKNPEKIREALRAGTCPFGCAYKADGKWAYAIPREPLEYFCRTGRLPDVAERAPERTDGEAATILREAARIYNGLADLLEQQAGARREVLLHA